MVLGYIKSEASQSQVDREAVDCQDAVAHALRPCGFVKKKTE